MGGGGRQACDREEEPKGEGFHGGTVLQEPAAVLTPVCTRTPTPPARLLGEPSYRYLSVKGCHLQQHGWT